LGNKAIAALSLNWLGNVALNAGRAADARGYFEEALAIRKELGDKRGIAATLANLGILLALREHDYILGETLLRQAIEVGREIGDRWLLAGTLVRLAISLVERGDLASAKLLYMESLALGEDLGTSSDISDALYGLGDIALIEGDYGTAEAFFERSLLAASNGSSPDFQSSFIRIRLAILAAYGSDYARADLLLRESLRSMRALSAHPITIRQYGFDYLVGMASVQEGLGYPNRAVKLLSTAQAALGELASTMRRGELMQYDRLVDATRLKLTVYEWEEAWDAGQTMSMEEAIQYAMGDT
jgi:tetratricopeptide (TPR) repeat protein